MMTLPVDTGVDSALSELKHSIGIYQSLSGGVGSADLCIILMKMIDVADDILCQEYKRARLEAGNMACLIIRSLVDSVHLRLNNIDAFVDDGRTLDKISDLCDRSSECSALADRKLFLLRALAVGFEQLKVTSNLDYPIVTSVDGERVQI